MKSRAKYDILRIFVAWVMVLNIFSSQSPSNLKAQVEEILRKFPAQSSEEMNDLAFEFILLGPKGIAEVCHRLSPPGVENDTQVRFLLHGLVKYTTRMGAEKERKMYAEALIKSLEKIPNYEVKAFIIRQLQLVGKNESVKSLGKFLKKI